MPAFVYLIPALALFQPTRFTAIVAAVDLRDPARDPARRHRDPLRAGDRRRGGPGVRGDRPPAALEGPAADVDAGAAARREPGDRDGPLDGRDRGPRRSGRARLRRHHRVRAGQGLRQGPRGGDRDRPARDHAGSDHAGRRQPPSGGSRLGPAETGDTLAVPQRRHRGGASGMRQTGWGRWFTGVAIVAIVVAGCAKSSGATPVPTTAAASSGGGTASGAPSDGAGRQPGGRSADLQGRRQQGHRPDDDQPVGRRRGQRRGRPVPAAADGLHGQDADPRRGGRLAGLRHR